MRDAVAIVPPVAWLAVWNRNIDTSATATATTGRKAPQEDTEGGEDRDDDNKQDRDRSGVLYSRIYSSVTSAATPAAADNVDDRTQRDLLSRRIGLAQGLIDFTRSFARKKPRRQNDDDAEEPPEDIDPTKEIKVVHSQNQRLVFLEPEKDYWIVAAFERYIPALPNALPKEKVAAPAPSSSSKGKQKQSQAQSQTRVHPSSLLPNEALIDLLRRAYAEFRLFNGTFGHNFEKQGVDALRASLGTFFDTWRREAKLIPLGIPKAFPLSTQDDLPDPPLGVSIVAISQSGIVDVPSATHGILTPADRLTLAYHLVSILPRPPPPAPAASTSKQKDKKVKKQASLSASTWKSLHLGGISNYLPSMPSMPGSSSTTSAAAKAGVTNNSGPSEPPSLTNPPGSARSLDDDRKIPASVDASKANHTGKRASSGSAWMSSFNPFGGSGNAKSKEVQSTSLPGDSQDPPAAAHQSAQPEADHTAQETQEQTPVEPPESAASAASMEALSEAMIDNISSEQLVGESARLAGPDTQASNVTITENASGLPTATAEIQKSITWHDPRIVYVGKDLKRMRCQCVNNDVIAMAVIQPENASSDISSTEEAEFDHALSTAESFFLRLVETYERQSKDQSIKPPTARTFVSLGSLDSDDIHEQVVDDRASASTASLGQRFNLALNGKTDTDKLMQSGASEVFVRTHYSQWLVGQKGDKRDSQSKLTILPKSIGKEGSLVDADAEMRRLAKEEAV